MSIGISQKRSVPELPGKKALRAEWENLAEGYVRLAEQTAASEQLDTLYEPDRRVTGKNQPNNPIMEAINGTINIRPTKRRACDGISKRRSQLGSRIRGASIEPEQSCNGRVTKASNKMAKDFESQSSGIREHTTTLTEKTLSNSVDFGRKCLRAKEPHELVQLQTEFMSQQAQLFAEQTKELGQKIQTATQGAYNTLADTARKTEQSITRADQSLKRHRSEA